MSNPAFSPRQLEQLDKKLDERFEQFEEKLDKKLDTRFEQFEEKLDKKLDTRFEEARADAHSMFRMIMDHMDKRFAEAEANSQSAIGTLLGDLDIKLRLALEPTRDVENRVKAIDNENLPGRVANLEAKLLPPAKPQRRRRG